MATNFFNQQWGAFDPDFNMMDTSDSVDQVLGYEQLDNQMMWIIGQADFGEGPQFNWQ